jgi:ubiquinone/menaquinone biosynthesis C-methylase UbiE
MGGCPAIYASVMAGDARQPADASGARLDEQRAYYRARAPEYDDWWFRRGRHDTGPEETAGWRAEVAELEARVDALALTGDVLELACGTGLWTRRLARSATRLTAVDAAPEALALNRGRDGTTDVTYVEADLFAWEPPAAAFDACFFGFWLSHVPSERFAAFWATVASALRPGGRAVWVDSGPTEAGRARDAAPERTRRSLADGREFRIVKRIYDPPSLEAELGALGWDAQVEHSPRGWFLLGEARATATGG